MLVYLTNSDRNRTNDFDSEKNYVDSSSVLNSISKMHKKIKYGMASKKWTCQTEMKI